MPQLQSLYKNEPDMGKHYWQSRATVSKNLLYVEHRLRPVNAGLKYVVNMFSSADRIKTKWMHLLQAKSTAVKS